MVGSGQRNAVSKKNKPKKLGRRARAREEKVEPQEPHSSKRSPTLLVVGLTVVVAVILLGVGKGASLFHDVPAASTLSSPAAKQGRVVDKVQTLRSAITGYQRLHPGEDNWWLTGVEPFMEFGQITARFRERFARLMLTYKDVSPLSQEIYAKLGSNFLLSKLMGGLSQQMLTPKQVEKIKGDPRGMSQFWEVCVIPQTEYNPRTTPGSLYYRKEWQAVMVAGVDRTDLWYAALLYHEMGHALRHRVQNAPSATAPSNSDSFIWEEMEMHELEHMILNQGTSGGFNRLLDTIIGRAGELKGNIFSEKYEQVCGSVKLQDMQSYDELFGIQQAGSITTPVHVSQFMISLGIRLVNRTVPKDQHHSAKISIYRSLNSR